METKQQMQQMQIEEVVFESLEGCNEAFAEMTLCGCCSARGGEFCGCGGKGGVGFQ